jgi:hypothetical protein
MVKDDWGSVINPKQQPSTNPAQKDSDCGFMNIVKLRELDPLGA